MNCKQGDLAIVTSLDESNSGKIVRCVRFIGRLEFDPQTGISLIGGPFPDCWEIDPPLTAEEFVYGVFVRTHLVPLYRDRYLRPLRGDLLDEETKEPVMVGIS